MDLMQFDSAFDTTFERDSEISLLFETFSDLTPYYRKLSHIDIIVEKDSIIFL